MVDPWLELPLSCLSLSVRIKTDRQKDIQADRQTGRKADRQVCRQADR
jgi:hypothetical protein